MAIGRIFGPMLYTTLDRQGVDLTFTNNGVPLLYFNNTDRVVQVRNGSGGVYVVNVDGNLAAGNVVLNNNATITTQGVNQRLLIQANGTANVFITNANVTSGRIDNTVIGGITPNTGKFNYLEATQQGVFATANVTNLTGGRVVFTSTSTQNLADSSQFLFFESNSTLYVGNLQTLSSQLFTTIDTGNLRVRNLVPGQVAFVAGNNWVIGNSSFTFSNANALLSTGNISIIAPSDTNQLLFVDPTDSNKVRGTTYVSFYNQTLYSNGITRLGTIQMSGSTITTTGTNQDLQLTASGLGVISASSKNIRNLAPPTEDSDAVTKNYVDNLVGFVQSAAKKIYNGVAPGSFVEVSDNDLFTANIVMNVQGQEYVRLQNGYVNIQDLRITNATLSTVAGQLEIAPANNDKINMRSNLSVLLPKGLTTEQPDNPVEGEFRYNTEQKSVEWYNGSYWTTPANNVVYSQTISPDGTSNSFTLRQDSVTDAVLVNFNGVIQTPGNTYSVANSTITFTTTPLSTDVIEIRFFNGTISHATNPITVDEPFVTVGTSFTTVDTWDIRTYRAARYSYTAKSLTSNNYEAGELMVVHDGISGFYTNSPVVRNGTTWLTWVVTLTAPGILALKLKGTATDTRVKFHRVYLTDG